MAWQYDDDAKAMVAGNGAERLAFQGRAGDRLTFRWEAEGGSLPVLVAAEDVTAARLRRWSVDYDEVVRDWSGGFAETIPDYIERQPWWPDRGLWQRADAAIEEALLLWPATAGTGPAPVFLKRRGGFLGYGWSEWLARYTLPPQPEPLIPDTPLRHLLGQHVPQWGEPDWPVPFVLPFETYKPYHELYKDGGPVRQAQDPASRYDPEHPTSRWRLLQSRRSEDFDVVMVAENAAERLVKEPVPAKGHGAFAYPYDPTYYRDGKGLELMFHIFPVGTVFGSYSSQGLFYSRHGIYPDTLEGTPRFLLRRGAEILPIGGDPVPEDIWHRADRAIVAALMEDIFGAKLPASRPGASRREKQKVLSLRAWGGYFNSTWTDGTAVGTSLVAYGQFMTDGHLERVSKVKIKLPLFREYVRDLRRLRPS